MAGPHEQQLEVDQKQNSNYYKENFQYKFQPKKIKLFFLVKERVILVERK